jgi:hypothetical protein
MAREGITSGSGDRVTSGDIDGGGGGGDSGDGGGSSNGSTGEVDPGDVNIDPDDINVDESDGGDTDSGGGGTSEPPSRPAGPGLDPGAGAGGIDDGDTDTDTGGGDTSEPPSRPAGPGLDPGAGAGNIDDGDTDVVNDRGTKGSLGPDVREVPPGVDPQNLSGGPTRPSDVTSPGFDQTQQSDPDGQGTAQGPPSGETIDTSDLPPGQRERIQQAEREARQNAADRLSEQYEGDVDPWQMRTEVGRRDGRYVVEPTLTSGARRDLRVAEAEANLERQLGIERAGQPYRDRLSPDYAETIDERTPDLEAGEDFVVEEGQVRLTDERRLAEVAETSPQLEREDLVVQDGKVQLSEDARQANLEAARAEQAKQVRDELNAPGFELGEELTVEDGSVTLTEQGERYLARDRVVEEYGLEPGEEFEVVQEDGETRVEVTDQGRVELAGRTDAPPGDVIASTEGWLREQSTAHRLGAPGAVLPNFEKASKSPSFNEFERGAAEFVGKDLLNPAGWGSTAWAGGKIAVDLAKVGSTGQIATAGSEEVKAESQQVYETSKAAVGRGIQSFEEKPLQTLGGATAAVGFGTVGGYAGGKVLGRASRATRDRLRTAGGTKIDLEDITQKPVIRNLETGGEIGDDFPGAANSDLYETNPPAAVRQQADEMTPQEVKEFFGEAGVTEGTTLKKAIDVEPEGPKTGRAGQGLEVPKGDYEAPGSFVGPELSPYFLRTAGRDPDFSWRPGLPDTGGTPTGVLAKTDVDAPDASTLGEFGDELRERAGETTAYTKPATEVAPGEIEAVIPPKAEFAPVRSGPLSGSLRRLGIGSEFYTKLPSGRRVPLRPVAKTDDISGTASRGFTDLLEDTRGQAGAAGTATRTTYRLDELADRGRRPVDRPLPLAAAPSVESTTKTNESIGSQVGGGASEPSSPIERMDRQFSPYEGEYIPEPLESETERSGYGGTAFDQPTGYSSPSVGYESDVSVPPADSVAVPGAGSTPPAPESGPHPNRKAMEPDSDEERIADLEVDALTETGFWDIQDPGGADLPGPDNEE